MNRLPFLQQTLPVNLRYCEEAGHAEIVLLDYNSSDGLSDWVKREMAYYLQRNILTFYQLVDPKPVHFSHPRSRNIAFRLATGEILCNVNADYFVSGTLFSFIRNTYTGGLRVAYIANFGETCKDNYGRLCVAKNDFLRVGGFDERFDGYGYEDTDLCLRLSMSGVKLKYLPLSCYSDFVGHQDTRRMENMRDAQEICSIFLSGISGRRRTILFLYRGGECQAGEVVQSSHDIPDLIEAAWCKGVWQRSENGRIDARFENGNVVALYRGEDALFGGDPGFKEIQDPALVEKLILKKSQIQNYRFLKDRRKSGNFVCNPTSFSVGKVLRNFNELIDLK